MHNSRASLLGLIPFTMHLRRRSRGRRDDEAIRRSHRLVAYLFAALQDAAAVGKVLGALEAYVAKEGTPPPVGRRERDSLVRTLGTDAVARAGPAVDDIACALGGAPAKRAAVTVRVPRWRAPGAGGKRKDAPAAASLPQQLDDPQPRKRARCGGGAGSSSSDEGDPNAGKALAAFLRDAGVPRREDEPFAGKLGEAGTTLALRMLQRCDWANGGDAGKFARALVASSCAPPLLAGLLSASEAGHPASALLSVVRLHELGADEAGDVAAAVAALLQSDEAEDLVWVARAAFLCNDAGLVLRLRAEYAALGLDADGLLGDALAGAHADGKSARLVYLLSRAGDADEGDGAGAASDDDDDAADADTELEVEVDAAEEAGAEPGDAVEVLGPQAFASVRALRACEDKLWGPRVEAARDVLSLYEALKRAETAGDVYAETARLAGCTRGRVNKLLPLGRAVRARRALGRALTLPSVVKPPPLLPLGKVFSPERFAGVADACEAVWAARGLRV
jgi:hypothetical protein